jgi:hypothetical protein
MERFFTMFPVARGFTVSFIEYRDVAPAASPIADFFLSPPSIGTLGARLTDTAAAHPEKVGCFVLAGSDFPDSVEDAIKRWGVTMAIKKDPHRLCTRGLVQYSAEGFTGLLPSPEAPTTAYKMHSANLCAT